MIWRIRRLLYLGISHQKLTYGMLMIESFSLDSAPLL